MSVNKKIMMVIPVLKGGGAERVSSVLLNSFKNKGFETEYLLTNSDEDEIINRDLDNDIPVTVLRKSFVTESVFVRIFYKLLRFFSSLICKVFESLKISVPVCFSYLSFISEYRKEIKAFRNKLKTEPDTTVIAFLQPAIPIVLLAACGLPNRVIISERGDPKRLVKSRYGYKFIEKYYMRADSAVFQTEDAKYTYPPNIAKKGYVIFNPINENLPKAYFGERNKNITTFCRISKQKNLPMLIEAFNEVHKAFPDYKLRIIGKPNNDDDMIALNDTNVLIDKYHLNDFVEFLPFSTSVHEDIIKDAMYVNSSDYEGMSNAMLEAMAIGMPVVCTDCPIGGARAVINHGVNGMLTKVGDCQDFAEKIISVLNDKELSRMLSANAVEIKTQLSISNITIQWEALL
ncbi:MAG: glycosyltransferase family 4 protein [Ruminococcaceae bacterium]|nr:glycosyltransferase family 4 protein [Oscillospiraceae bacterium]